ncbi:DUF2079 domain-containing protein [Streptomyces sp. NPDC015139]|uniref:DUF2079 domain-containing protein n=1 Tax=Streptomyces sp. NPDC015139 TaxID=3364942 RepID=UPI0036FB6A45
MTQKTRLKNKSRAAMLGTPSRWSPPQRLDGHLLAVTCTALYAVLALSRWLNYRTMSWDLGIFEQVVSGYAHWQEPVSDLKGPGFNILGDHFSPVVALLAPLHGIWPSPVTLLMAQSVLLGWSVWPVTSAAAHLLGRRTGLLLGASYGLSWGLQRAADFDFHEIAFAVPMIAASLSALVTRRWYAALLWALPLVLVKEDLGMTCMVVALITAQRCRRGRTGLALIALATAAVGAVCCLFTVTVIIPAASGHGYDYWVKIGDRTDPVTALFRHGGGEKLRTLIWTLLPTTGLLALRSPLLLIATPTLLWRFLSNDEHYWSTDWHYSAVLMPITTIALVDALAAVRCTRRLYLRIYAGHLPTALLASALALCTTLPFATLTEAATYRADPAAKAGANVLATVPDGATVEVDIVPSAHLADRCRVFWIGDAGRGADYIASYDPDHNSAEMLARAEQLHPHQRYTVISNASGYWVLKHIPNGTR